MKKIYKLAIILLSCFSLMISYKQCSHCDHICTKLCKHDMNGECISHNCDNEKQLVDEDDYLG